MKKLLALILSLVLALNIALPVLAEEPTPASALPTVESTTTTAEKEVSEEELTEEEAIDEVVSVIIFTGQENAATPTEPPVNETPAGFTPDNTVLYLFDKMLENIQLALAKTPEAKARLLTIISQERMAELEALDPLRLEKYVDSLLADITASLEKAADAITAAKEKGAEIDKLAVTLAQAGKLGSSVELPELLRKSEKTEGAAKELEKASKKAIVKAAVVRDVAPEVVESLRSQGLGFGQIALLNKMAVALVDVAEGEDKMDKVLAIFAETKSIGQTKHALGQKHKSKQEKYATSRAEELNADKDDEKDDKDDDKKEVVKSKRKEHTPAGEKQNNGKGNAAKKNTPAKGKGK